MIKNIITPENKECCEKCEVLESWTYCGNPSCECHKEEPARIHGSSLHAFGNLPDTSKVNTAKQGEIPMGISQWREHGKKYGYFDFFGGESKDWGISKVNRVEVIDHTKDLMEGGGRKSYNNKIMKLTTKQKEDIDFYTTFSIFKRAPTNDERKEYLEFSEHGVKPKLTNGLILNPIIDGKSKLGLSIQLWQEGILDGSVPYFVLLGGFEGGKRKWWQFWKPKFAHKPVSRRLVDYMKTQMFKGVDAEIIESCYQLILNEK